VEIAFRFHAAGIYATWFDSPDSDMPNMLQEDVEERSISSI